MSIRAQDFLSGPGYDVNAHIERLREQHRAYPLRGNEATHKHCIAFMARLMKRVPRTPAEHFLELIYGVITFLFENERVYDPPFPFFTSTEHPPVYFKRALEALEVQLSTPFRERIERAVENIVIECVTKAPEGAFIEEEDGSSTVPLHESVNCRDWVIYLFRAGMNDLDFPRMRQVLMRYLHEASGKIYDPEEPADKLVYPERSKLDGMELAEAYLRDTPLIAFLQAKLPFTIPQNTRFSGQWVLAPPNRGKTNMLLHQIERDIEEKASILVMDSKGDLITPLKTLRSIKDRLVVLEPSAEHPLAINPLDLGASTTHIVSFIEYVFSSILEAEPTPLQNTLFRAVLLLLRQVPNATFEDFRKILTQGAADYEKYLPKMEPEDREFFTPFGNKVSEFDSPTYAATKTQLLWRIRDLTTRIPILRAMFRAPKTLINMGDLMDSGKIVILDVRKQLLGDEGAEFLGRLYIALVRAAADQRSSRRHEDKLPCYFYIDEAHTIISEDTKLAGILQECRSQKIAMVLAHQAISQISNQVTLGALSDCAIRMANSDEETSKLASRLRTSPEVLQSLPIGTFATFVRDTTKQAVQLRIPLAKLPTAPRMTQDEQRELQARMRANYTYQRPSPEQSQEQDAPAPQKPSGLADALKAFAAEPASQSTGAEPTAEKW